jgi:heme-degrading monooxygenase HmoA
VILRILHGRVPPGGLDQLAEGFASRYLPLARATPGLVRFHVAVRPDGEAHRLAVVTFWNSVDAALAAYDGNLDTARTLDGLSEHADLTDVAYFEVDESRLRRSTADAAILRIAVGRVVQGLDVAVQLDLRERMHELDPAMTEAYVGRRILGRDVEVAFISAWQHAPAGRSLDEPLWPDVAERLGSFAAETYLTILSGASAAGPGSAGGA